MSNNLAKAITMSRARELVGNIAQTNHYLVVIPTGLTPELSAHIEEYSQISNPKDFISRRLGFLCSEASLPTSSYATAEVKDNFMGVTQEFAHTRLYADSDFTFYVDSNYDSIKFFESWLDYISGTGESQSGGKGYFRRFAFPDFYKVSTMSINKFEKDYKRVLEYKFINAFPKGMVSIPVSYGPADLMKVTVTFNYDRYIVYSKEIIPQTELTTDEQIKQAFNAGVAQGNQNWINNPLIPLDVLNAAPRDPITGKIDLSKILGLLSRRNVSGIGGDNGRGSEVIRDRIVI